MPVIRRRSSNPYAPVPRERLALPGPAREALVGPAKVFAYVHKYPPVHNAGAEWMLHTMMRHLADLGHECRVVADVGSSYVLDGVRVDPERYARAGFGWADVAVTHLDRTAHAISLASAARLPLVHLVHNDAQLHFHRVRTGDVSLAVWNSEWLAESYRGFHTRAEVVVRPPVTSTDYRTPRGDADRVTLINLTRAKGAPVLFALAGRMPDDLFLGVRGAYGLQAEPPARLPNLEIVDQTPRIREVYTRTSILLVPSGYESWGRVAVEAMASGIPVVASPTPGLRESLGDAGLFVELDDLDGWTEAVRRLRTDAGFYGERSAMALERSAELDAVTAEDLETWTTWLLRCAAAGRGS